MRLIVKKGANVIFEEDSFLFEMSSENGYITFSRDYKGGNMGDLYRLTQRKFDSEYLYNGEPIELSNTPIIHGTLKVSIDEEELHPTQYTVGVDNFAIIDERINEIAREQPLNVLVEYSYITRHTFSLYRGHIQLLSVDGYLEDYFVVTDRNPSNRHELKENIRVVIDKITWGGE